MTVKHSFNNSNCSSINNNNKAQRHRHRSKNNKIKSKNYNHHFIITHMFICLVSHLLFYSHASLPPLTHTDTDLFSVSFHLASSCPISLIPISELHCLNIVTSTIMWISAQSLISNVTPSLHSSASILPTTPG